MDPQDSQPFAELLGTAHASAYVLQALAEDSLVLPVHVRLEKVLEEAVQVFGAAVVEGSLEAEVVEASFDSDFGYDPYGFLEQGKAGTASDPWVDHLRSNSHCC